MAYFTRCAALGQTVLTAMIYFNSVMAKQVAKTKKTQAPVKNKKIKQVKKTAPKNTLPKNDVHQGLSERLRLDESYASLILGALVVVFLIVFLIVVLGSKKAVSEIQLKMSPTPTPAKAMQVTRKTYVLQDGEGLWDVAVKFYGDGNKWILISQANHLDNPDNVEPGTKLIIPQQ